VQIGVYSTSLFEGMALGARTILVDLPGIESMTGVLEAGEASLARNGAEIAAALGVAPMVVDTSRYYAPPVKSVFTVATAA